MLNTTVAAFINTTVKGLGKSIAEQTATSTIVALDSIEEAKEVISTLELDIDYEDEDYITAYGYCPELGEEGSISVVAGQFEEYPIALVFEHADEEF